MVGYAVISVFVRDELNAGDPGASLRFRIRDHPVELARDQQGGAPYALDPLEGQEVCPTPGVRLVRGARTMRERLSRDLGQLVPDVAELERTRV